MDAQTTLTVAVNNSESGASAQNEGLNPAAITRRVAEEFDRFIEGVGRGNWLVPFFGSAPIRKRVEELNNIGMLLPDIDMLRRGDEIIVRADLPGVPKENIHLELKDGALLLRGESVGEEEQAGDEYYRRERSRGTFSRSIPLPPEVVAENVKATFRDGVLEVVIAAPRRETGGTQVKID